MSELPNSNKSLFQNWLSIIGAILSIVIFSAILVLIVLEFLSKEINPYTQSITYVGLPAFLILTLFLIFFGAWRERSARRKRGYVRKFPQIDFNNPAHQRWALIGIGFFTVFLIFSMFGTYKAYQFSESVTFCGKTCHQVMHPEFTAYHKSPHARVSCVECHVGPGPDYYLKSKINGAHQIYSSIFKKYSKPIPAPVKNLRPAQETCEHCHWPEKFFGAIEKDHQYFMSDESNTLWNTRMLMYVGGGEKAHGSHWHVNPANKVYYVSTDEKRQIIPWVKVVYEDGREEYFVDSESKFSASKPPQGEIRKMDCIDCHNRPSHQYEAPSRSVNKAMGKGDIAAELPYMKREAVKVLVGKYESHDDAAAQIRSRLEKFYEDNYPEVFQNQKNKLDRSIQAIVEIYQSNFFPGMNVSWKAYPDNIGHMMAPGCFRCHDGKHESPQGKIISNDCKICHGIIAQGPFGAMESSVDGLEFKHPDGDQESWKEISCMDCHTGGPA